MSREKSSIRQAVEGLLIACDVGQVVTYNEMAQVAGCTEERVKTFTSRAIKTVEKTFRHVFKVIANVGYERVRSDLAFDRSESQRRSAVRKVDRAIFSLAAALDGADGALQGMIANRLIGLSTTRQFLNQRKTTVPLRAPARPVDLSRFLAAVPQKEDER